MQLEVVRPPVAGQEPSLALLPPNYDLTIRIALAWELWI